jgi:hypothetical protein
VVSNYYAELEERRANDQELMPDEATLTALAGLALLKGWGGVTFINGHPTDTVEVA